MILLPSTTFAQPLDISWTVVPKPSSGYAPLPVTIYYTFRNNDPNFGDFGFWPEDPVCKDVKYVSGDINGDGSINVGETWNWTCSVTIEKTITSDSSITGGKCIMVNGTQFCVDFGVVWTVTILPVGGEIMSSNPTSLFVAGAFANAYWVVPTLFGLAGAAAAIFRMKNRT